MKRFFCANKNLKRFYSWKIQKEKYLNDFGCTLKQYKNDLGTEYLKFESTVQYPSFTLTFKTPKEENGHIPLLLSKMLQNIERDIFTKTYITSFQCLNYPSHTIITMNSNNEKDLENAISYILKRIFFPYFDFEQILLNQDGILDGSLLMELKQMETDETYYFKRELYKMIYQQIYPKYFFGNDLDLRKITLEKVIDFHSKYFHPSNCLIITTGYKNEFFQQIDSIFYQFVKKEFPTIDIIPKIQSKNLILESPFKNSYFGVSWITNNTDNSYETTLLSILGKYITQLSFSPLSNFPDSYMIRDISGYDSFLTLSIFTIVFNGNIEMNSFEKILSEKVKDIQNMKIDLMSIHPILQYIELSIRNMPFQELVFPLLISQFWNNKRDVFSCLELSQIFQKARKDISQGELSNLMKKYFENGSKLIMKGTEKQVATFNDIPIELKESKLKNQNLEPYQGYIMLEFNFENYLVEKLNDNIYYYHQKLNGMTNLTIKSLSLKILDSDIVFLPLTIYLIERIGARGMESLNFSLKLQNYCHEFTMKPYIEHNPNQIDEIKVGMIIQTSFMTKDVFKVMDLISALFNESHLFESSNHEIFEELMHEFYSEKDSQFYSQLTNMLKVHSSTMLSPMSQMNNIFNGLISYNVMSSIPLKEDLIKKCKNLAKGILNRNNISLLFISDEKDLNYDAMTDFIQSLTNLEMKEFEFGFIPRSLKEFIQNPLPQISICFSTRTLISSHPDNGIILVISKLISIKYPEYTTDFSIISSALSIIEMNVFDIEKSIEKIGKVFDFIILNQYTDEEFKEAKLIALKNLTAYLSPFEKPNIEFLFRNSNESRKIQQEKLIQATRSDLSESVKKYLQGSPKFENIDTQSDQTTSSFVQNFTVMCPKDKIPEKFKNQKIWNISIKEDEKPSDIEVL